MVELDGIYVNEDNFVGSIVFSSRIDHVVQKIMLSVVEPLLQNFIEFLKWKICTICCFEYAIVL
jgi:hypothetical protein